MLGNKTNKQKTNLDKSGWVGLENEDYRETVSRANARTLAGINVPFDKKANVPFYNKVFDATIDRFKSISKSIVYGAVFSYKFTGYLLAEVFAKIQSIVHRDSNVKKPVEKSFGIDDLSLTDTVKNQLVQKEIEAVAKTLDARLPSYEESQSEERGNPPSYEEAVKAGELEALERELSDLDAWGKSGLEPTSAHEFQDVIVEPNKQTAEPFVSLEAATPSYTDRSYVRYNDNTALQGVIVEPNKQTAEPFVSLEAATPSYPANSSGHDTLNVALCARQLPTTVDSIEVTPPPTYEEAIQGQQPNSSLDGHVRAEHPIAELRAIFERI